MGRLTIPSLIRCTSGRVFRKAEETDEQYLMRITHLYLENKQLDSIGREMSLCKNLVVIYLYDNKLTEIPDFSVCASLSQLYLQNNLLTRINNLSHLTNLTKLYLSRNQINVLEGLEDCIQLQELHMEYQDYQHPLDQLVFDPRSIRAIMESLTTLNIAGNRIRDIQPISTLRSLVHLNICDNQLEDADKIVSQFSLASYSGCRQLMKLEVKGNPFCMGSGVNDNDGFNRNSKTANVRSSKKSGAYTNTGKKYRDLFILTFPSLESIDGKAISDTSRRFLQNWKASKEAANDRKREGTTMNIKRDTQFSQHSSNYLNKNDDIAGHISNSNHFKNSTAQSRGSGEERLLRPKSISFDRSRFRQNKRNQSATLSYLI